MEVEPAHLTVRTLHARMVIAGPNFPRLASAAKGRPTPVMDLPAHMIPYARPLRRTNHSSTWSVVGVNRSPHPRADTTPCVRINCHKVVEKDDKRKPVAARKRPMGPNHRRSHGHRVRMKNVKGEMRYIIPCSIESVNMSHLQKKKTLDCNILTVTVVPITATLPVSPFSNASGWLS